MILDRYMATDFLKMLNQLKNENIVTYIRMLKHMHWDLSLFCGLIFSLYFIAYT